MKYALVSLFFLCSFAVQARETDKKDEVITSFKVIFNAAAEIQPEPTGVWETDSDSLGHFTIEIGDASGRSPKARATFESKKDHCSATADAEFNPGGGDNAYVFVPPRSSKPAAAKSSFCQRQVVAFINRAQATYTSKTTIVYMARIFSSAEEKNLMIYFLKLKKVK